MPVPREDSGGKVHQLVDGLPGDGASKCPGGEAIEQFAGIGTAVVLARGNVLREEPSVVPGTDPVPLIERAADRDRLDADGERTDLFFGRCQRLELERELMVAGLPGDIDHVVIGSTVLPAKFTLQALAAVDLERQPAAVEVEDAIDEPFVGGQIDNQLVPTGDVDPDRRCNDRGLVI